MTYDHHQYINHTHKYKNGGGGGESCCKIGKCDGCRSAINKCFLSGRDSVVIGIESCY